MWTPQPGPQAEAIISTWCGECFFGGARGGGKSSYLLGDYLQDVPRYGVNWQGVIFRRTYPELQELIKRSQEMYSPTGAVWRESDKSWTWANGACLKLRYLEHPRDASRYQGFEFQWIGWDELTQWATDEAYRMLFACLRCSSADVPTKRIRSSGNPGGAGHAWIKARFVDNAPLGLEPVLDPTTGMYRMYIKSLVTDNKILLERDPQYIERLKGSGSAELVRGWLEGDWSAIAGAYFTEFGLHHVIRPFEIPRHLIRFRSFDWGSMRPFVCGWYVVNDGSIKEYPAKSIIKYREWYGGKANVGLKLQVEEVAKGILARQEPKEEITYSVADPAIFREDGGPSIAETMRKHGVSFRAADNERVAGWTQLRSRLIGIDDKPLIYFFSTCVDSIRTIPTLQHDTAKPEDVNSEGDDHCADEVRYACMSRPYARPIAPAKPLRTVHDATLNELWDISRSNSKEHRI